MGSSPLTRGKPALPVPLGDVTRLIPAHAGKTPIRTSEFTHYSAHPRSRGENDAGVSGDGHLLGSSPLTRGKRQRQVADVAMERLIPAHAGKTLPRALACPPSQAHPRSRGENISATLISRPERGSSPLTRGKHFLTCAFTAQIDQILETLELAASFGSYLIWVACATDAPQDPVRSIGLVLPSSMGAS